jgi:Na+/citrate or Na+/malate symporter
MEQLEVKNEGQIIAGMVVALVFGFLLASIGQTYHIFSLYSLGSVIAGLFFSTTIFYTIIALKKK